MTVFLLYESYCGDPLTIVSIHSTREKAMEAKEKLELLEDSEFCKYLISNWVVD